MPRQFESLTLLGLDRRVALVYAGLSLLALAGYAMAWPEAPLTGVDTARYLEAARDLADFRIDHLQFRTPGYPLLLLLTGSSEQPARPLFYVSLGLHFAAVWLIGTVLHALRFPTWAAVAAGVALVLPPFVENAAYALSETLTQFMLVCGFAGLFHWFRMRSTGWLIASSFAFAYAGLTRPTYQVVAFAIVLTAAVCRIRLGRAAASVMLTSLLFVGGYTAFNYVKFGFPGVTPMLGFHLGTKTVRVLERIPERDAAVKAVLLRHRDGHLVQPNSSHTGYMYVWSSVPDLQQATGMDLPELSRYLQQIHLRLIAGAPLEYAMEVLRAACSYWFPSITAVGAMDSRVLQLVWSMVHLGLIAVFLLQLVLLAGSTAYLAARRQAIGFTGLELLAYSMAGTLILYTMLVSILVESGVSRVRTPADIFLVAMTAIGIRIWLRQVHREAPAAPAVPSHREAAVR
jgi:hypothetical protein